MVGHKHLEASEADDREVARDGELKGACINPTSSGLNMPKA